MIHQLKNRMNVKQELVDVQLLLKAQLNYLVQAVMAVPVVVIIL